MDIINKTILIIDDHDCIRLLLGNILSKNYHVVTRKNALEALAWLNEGNIPDMILLDLAMPSISGYELLKNLRYSGYYKDVPVMILSGSGDEVDIERCYDLGINDFFQKPFNPIQLREKISQTFRTKERELTVPSTARRPYLVKVAAG